MCMPACRKEPKRARRGVWEVFMLPACISQPCQMITSPFFPANCTPVAVDLAASPPSEACGSADNYEGVRFVWISNGAKSAGSFTLSNISVVSAVR